ncbi:acetylornithine deacetylase [Aliiroseovarius sp.]|uniref:acetylornithine deacetylase n=1 Tax=Aliiroseovarius sp. TaxID=1872442 RepID=UPI00261851D1|nr:acetylornithine deacetylase [Aliiroseovarius sp.]
MNRTLEILDRLIAFPTVSADSNLALIDYVQGLLSRAGFLVTRISSPCGQKAGLFARIGAGEGGVCLSAHADVVPVAGQDWTRDPFRLTRDDTRLYGRGVTDMKGFLASALALAEEAGAQADAPALSLVISYDEEIGCVGIRQMMPALEPLIGRPRAVIVGEPTSMQVAIGHKGKAALEVTCHGQSGHSALAPDFINALHLASGFVTAMIDLQEVLSREVRDPGHAVPYSTVHIGRMEGGRALNIVPDHARILMEYRHLADIPGSELRARIETAAKQVAAGFGMPEGIMVKEVTAYPGLATSPEAPVVDWARRMAGGADVTKVAFGTEAGFFAALDLPTVVMGPGDMARDGHKPDEGLDLGELAACGTMLARVLEPG